jgi:formate hydrogenlyase subunit 6/NADH:ubiquinone oxidoreductase subunit I
LAYVIDEDRCINCSWCRRVCPTDTISYFETDVRKHRIDPEGCIDCDICAKVCPMSCISPQPEVRPTPEHLEAARDKARRRAGDRRRLIVGLRAYAESQVRRLA